MDQHMNTTSTQKLITSNEALRRLGMAGGGNPIRRLANYGITVTATTGDKKKWYFVPEAEVDAAVQRVKEQKEKNKTKAVDAMMASRNYVKIDEVKKLEELVLRLIDEVESLKREIRKGE